MRVGVPAEVEDHEYRVAVTPAGVLELVRNGHGVSGERGAGPGGSITGEEFLSAGVEVLEPADDVWGSAELVLEVEEPIEDG